MVSDHEPNISLDELRLAVEDVMGEPFSADDPAHTVAIILLAGTHVGANEEAVSLFTGIPLSVVDGIATNLRQSGIWTDDGKTSMTWDDEEGGGAAFLMDVMCGQGLMQRVVTP